MNTAKKNNAFPIRLIQRLKDAKPKRDKKKRTNNTQTLGQTWVTFIYHSSLTRKATNTFKDTDRRTAYRATNTLFSKLQTVKEPRDTLRTRGAYKLTSGTGSRSDGMTIQNQICRTPKIH